MIQKRLKQNINTSAIIDNTGNTQDITQLKIDVANNTQQINTNTNDITNLQTQVAQNTQDITGFNQITTDLQTKYNGLESKVTQNQTDINDLQTKANQLEPRVAQNETDIAAIKLDTAKIDPLVTRVDTLEPIVTDNQTKVAEIAPLKTRVDTLEPKVTQNENDINALQTTVQDLEPRVAANEASITAINSTLTNVAKKNEQNTFTMQQNFNADIVLTNSSIKSTTGDLNINQGGSGRVQVKTAMVMNNNWIANLHDPNSPQDAATKNYVDNADTAISNRVTNIETSLANGNIVNYVGNYNSATTYAVGQCVTFNDKWYVSKINGNVGHQPDTSPTQWELLSAPSVDLTPYLTKQEASTTYETIANVNALTTRVNTNEQNINTINTTLNGVAKLATNNTFTANNTFNNALTMPGATALKHTGTNWSLGEISNQNLKNINIDFNQQSGDYKNYCNFNIRYKHRTANYINLLAFEFRPDNNEALNVSTRMNYISFGNINLKCSRTPTDNDNLTNKQYVDNLLSNKANASDLTTLSGRVDTNTQDITNCAKLNAQNIFSANQVIKGGTLSKFALRNTNNQDIISLEVTTSGNQGVIKNNGGGTIRYENGANPTNPTDLTNKQYVDTAINGCAKLASANTFTQANTFNGAVNFKNRVELKNANNNGAFLENFDYNNKNYTSLKFFKNTSQNYLQIEVNNTDGESFISSPASTNALHIQNLANPTSNNDAANKQYVDSGDLPNIAAANTEYANGRQTFLGQQVYVQYLNSQINITSSTNQATITITGATRIINTQLSFSHSSTATDYTAPLPFIIFQSGTTTISQSIFSTYTGNVITLSATGLSGQKYIRGFVFYIK